MRGARGVLVAVVAALVVLPGGASAQQVEDWTITSYDAIVEVDAETGDLYVDEAIQLDFGQLQRRGIFRYIPVWFDLPTPLPPELEDAVPEGADPGDHQRVVEVDQVQVDSPSGAPAEVDVSGPGDNDGNVVIRIGDPDVTVTGSQEYHLTYRVRGALDPLPGGGAGLAWNAVGTGWPVPIEEATALVIADGIEEARCLQGRQGATDTCTAERTADDEVEYAATGRLAPHEGLTLVAELADGAVADVSVLVDERPSLRRFFIGSGWSVPLAVVVLVAGAGLLAWLGWRQGRDRVNRGGVTSHGEVDPNAADVRRRGLFEPRPVPVEYRPPEGLRPGQLGLVIDERVDAVDVTATIVDLAVRGHLRIEEVDPGGRSRTGDWRLVQGHEPDDELLGYERLLLEGLFDEGEEVLVSDLKGTFTRTYEKVETGIYADGQSRRWFAARPDRTRTQWLGTGALVAVLGALATFFLGGMARMGLVGVAVLLVGVVLMAMHRHMPHRTPRGSALLTRTLGFREFVEQAEADRMEFAEREQLFVEYLPYAVVFGCVDRWAEAFEDLGVDVGSAVSGFYVGPGTFHLMAFSAGMHGFSSSVGSAVVAAPPSSGSGGFSGGGFGGGGGFSGGGMGGGGGGSW